MKKALTAIALSATTLFSAVPSSGLTAYYNFNNNFTDQSGNSKNLTNNGVTFTTDRSGNENSAAYFNGTDARAFYNGTVQTTTTEWAISAWVKTEAATGGSSVVVTTGNTSSNGYGLVASSNTAAGALWGHTYFGTSGVTFSPGVWQHILIMRKSGSTACYINGVQSGTVVPQGPFTPNAFCIGSSLVPNAFYKGALDDIRVYNRALTNDEITLLRIENMVVSGTKTIWSTDQILTENHTVEVGDTLVINSGVKVLLVFVDGNLDNIGDISFTVNGVLLSKGTDLSPVIFESYDQKNNIQAWSGLTIYSNNGILSNVKVRNALTGLKIVGSGNTLINLHCDSLKVGFKISGPNTRFLNSEVLGCDSGIIASNANELLLNNMSILNNNGVGIKLSTTSTIITGVTVKYNGGLGGIYSVGTSMSEISLTEVDSNETYGLFIDNGSVFTITKSTFIKNKKFAILVHSNTSNAITMSECSIYDNGTLLVSEEDLIDVSTLNMQNTYPTQNALYNIPSYTHTINTSGKNSSIHSSQSYALSIGTWSSPTHNVGSAGSWYTDVINNLPFESELLKVTLNHYSQLYFVNTSINGYGFNHPYQLLYLTGTNNTISAKNNWWGQLTRIDTLIGTQSLVNYSGFKTSKITDAGADNFTNVIAVSPQSTTFANTPIGFSDSVEIKISNNGKAPLIIDSIITEGSVFIVVNDNPIFLAGESKTVTVKFTPTAEVTSNGYLNIYSDDGVSPLKQVALSGTGMPPNSAPVFTAKPADTLIIAGVMFSKAVVATDANGASDTLKYSLLQAPVAMVIDSLTGTISWQTLSTDITDTVVIVAKDMYGLSDTTDFEISVNHRPYFSGAVPTDTLILPGETYSFDINALDSDGHSLTYSLDSTVGSMAISGISGLISYTAVSANIGSHTIVVKVTDELGAATTVSFVLSVFNETAIILNDKTQKTGIFDLYITPNPVDQTAAGVNLIIPSKLSGYWKIVVSDALGNILDKADFEAIGGTTYTWDLHSMFDVRVASGSYVLIAQYTDRSGRTQMFRRMIGVKE